MSFSNFQNSRFLGRIHINRLINCCSEMSTTVSSNQSSVFFIYVSVRDRQALRQVYRQAMAKMKTTPRASIPTPVTTAAKRPDKTKKFLASIDTALNIFDDQVSSIDNRCETAYKTFAKTYREAFCRHMAKNK